MPTKIYLITSNLAIPAGERLPPAAVPMADLLGLVKDVKSLQVDLGGADLVPVLTHLDRINELAKKIGGADKLAEMLAVFA